MRFDIVPPDVEPVLAGSVNGRALFANLVKGIEADPPAPSPLFLDFRNATLATASYLRESVFALKSYLRHADSRYYPVVANANDLVLEELFTVANARNDVILACDLDDHDAASNIHLIGQLDPKQQLTFDLVQELKDTDANRLMERYGEAEQTKSVTAWNNRLASLASKGIIREFTRGRAKSYRPVLEVTT